jgi:hypothetical protein
MKRWTNPNCGKQVRNKAKVCDQGGRGEFLGARIEWLDELHARQPAPLLSPQ